MARLFLHIGYPRLFDVDFEILQNPAAPLGPDQAYLPHWPVPGLIPRGSAREGLRTLAYAGRIGPLNLAPELQKSAEVLLPDLEMQVIPPERWHDMSQIDALLAIRTFDMAPHMTKPPSKLFSAWLANVPLIAGHDSAFSAVGEPGADYLRVASLEELREALRRLRDDPALYARIVENGRRKAAGVNHEAIAEEWLRVLDTRIAPRFERWQEEPLKGLRGIAARSADRARATASRLKRPRGRKRRVHK